MPRGERVSVGNVHRLVARKLGRCARCIRLSMLFSLLGWASFALFSAAIPSSFLATGAFLWALGLTGLFASHIVAFAVRIVQRQKAAERSGEGTRARAADLSKSRRDFLITSLKLAGLGLAAVVVPSMLASNATAGDCSTCTCKKCHGMMPGHCPGAKTCDYLCWLNCQG